MQSMYLKIATSSKDNINIRNLSESVWTINITERPMFKLLKRWINLFSMRDIAKQDNLLLAYNRLLTNPESTYKNFFRDTYSAYGMAISKNIALLHKEVKSGYLPVDTVRVFMPKANGLSRMYTPVLGEKAAHNGKVVYSLDFEVTPHQLRHTYITNLIHASVDPKTVQYLAGHESSKITMDIYAKVKYNRPDELVRSMSGAFAGWEAV